MLNSIFVIIGTIIGAGFASGKEIFTFFNMHGIYGFIGLIFSTSIIGFVIYKSLSIIIMHNVESYRDFISLTITKSKFMNSIICNIINIFLLVSFIVMVAGFSAYFTQEFNFPSIFGSLLISVLCFLTFLNNIDGIVKTNKYFIPFLIFIILLLGFKNINCLTSFNYHTSSVTHNWIISAVLYASYNLIIVIPILISLKDIVKKINTAKIVSFFSTFFLLLMAITLFCLLNYYFEDIKNLELPTIYIASTFGKSFQFVCGFVILGAIFTTAISSGYGFLNNLNMANKKLYCIISIIICMVSIALSNIGFSTLLNSLYPILGILRFCADCFYIIFYQNTLKNLYFIDISM